MIRCFFKINFVNRSFLRHGSLIQRSKPVATQLAGSDETMPSQLPRPLQRRLTALINYLDI